MSVERSKRFNGKLDVTYITKSSLNEDLGQNRTTLSKKGAVFGKTLRRVPLQSIMACTLLFAALLHVECTSFWWNMCVGTACSLVACQEILFMILLTCGKNVSPSCCCAEQGMADTKRVPGPTYYAPRLGLVDKKDVYSKTNLKSSIQYSFGKAQLPWQKKVKPTQGVRERVRDSSERQVSPYLLFSCMLCERFTCSCLLYSRHQS